MATRIAVGHFLHESNSFSSEKTGIEQFRTLPMYLANGWCSGAEMIGVARGTLTVIGAAIDCAKEYGWELLPLAVAETIPSGPLTSSIYKEIKSRMLAPLEGSKTDAVLLHLHGAAVVEGMVDCEGDLLGAIRDRVSPGTPIVVVLDLHANVSQRMLDATDMLIGYDTEPHQDLYERGMEAAGVVRAMLEDGLRPQARRAQPPMILPAENECTSNEPMRGLMARAFEWEKRPGVLDVSVFGGFYGSDEPEAGPCIVATTTGDGDLAQRIVDDVVCRMWAVREQFLRPTTPVAEAVKAVRPGEGVFALIDGADDVLGGAPGDGTAVLQELLRLGVRRAGVSSIWDPEVAQLAFNAGVGAEISGRLGGKTDDRHGPSLPFRAHVRGLHTGRIPFAHWDESITQDVGRIALIDVDGITVPVTERKAATESMDMFGALGLNVDEFDVVVLKGLGNTYRVTYGDRLRAYVEVESEGCTNPNLRRIGRYRRLRRPIFPLDGDVEYMDAKCLDAESIEPGGERQ